MNAFMKWSRYFFTGILSIYAIGCLFLYFFQENLIFNPTELPENYAFGEGQEVEIEVEEDTYLNCLHLKNGSSKGVILFLHGNRGSNRRCLRQASVFLGSDYDIFMPDYRGYGKSDGAIESQKELLSDVQAVYDHLLTQYEESDIAVVGYSLGTGPASYLAANNDPKHLFLVAPYTSFVDLKNQRFPLVPDFLVKYPLNNTKFIPQSSCPVALFHAPGDQVIPYSSSERLFALDKNRIDMITLAGAGHRGSIFHQDVRSYVSRVLN